MQLEWGAGSQQRQVRNSRAMESHEARRQPPGKFVLRLVAGCVLATILVSACSGPTVVPTQEASTSAPGINGSRSAELATATGPSDPQEASAATTTASPPAPPEASSPIQGTFTSPVPPPGGEGDIGETVASRVVTTQGSVGVSSAAALGQGVSATVLEISSTTAEAIGPGEVGGYVLAVTIELDNRSSSDVDLNEVFVTLTDSANQVGIPTTGGIASPLSGHLAAGKTAKGVYVFTVPESNRASVTILVSDARSATAVAFTGSAS